MRCDFCSSPDVRFAYPAVDFVIPTIKFGGQPIAAGSRGGWAACITCSRLILNNDRNGLLQRSVDQFFIAYESNIPRDVIERTIAEIHSSFFASRSGPPIPTSVIF